MSACARYVYISNWTELSVNIGTVESTAYIKLGNMYCKYISCMQLNNRELLIPYMQKSAKYSGNLILFSNYHYKIFIINNLII